METKTKVVFVIIATLCILAIFFSGYLLGSAHQVNKLGEDTKNLINSIDNSIKITEEQKEHIISTLNLTSSAELSFDLIIQACDDLKSSLDYSNEQIKAISKQLEIKKENEQSFLNKYSETTESDLNILDFLIQEAEALENK